MQTQRTLSHNCHTVGITSVPCQPNHRITDQLRSGGTSGDDLPQAPALSHELRAVFSWVLKTSKDGNSTAGLWIQAWNTKGLHFSFSYTKIHPISILLSIHLKLQIHSIAASARTVCVFYMYSHILYVPLHSNHWDYLIATKSFSSYKYTNQKLLLLFYFSVWNKRVQPQLKSSCRTLRTMNQPTNYLFENLVKAAKMLF